MTKSYRSKVVQAIWHQIKKHWVHTSAHVSLPLVPSHLSHEEKMEGKYVRNWGNAFLLKVIWSNVSFRWQQHSWISCQCNWLLTICAYNVMYYPDNNEGAQLPLLALFFLMMSFHMTKHIGILSLKFCVWQTSHMDNKPWLRLCVEQSNHY